MWLVVLLLVAAAGGAAAVMLPRHTDQPQAVAGAPPPEKPLGVGARGRIEPEDGVLVLGGPYFNGRPSLVRELRVKEGDSVRAGQVIAILDGFIQLEKAVRQNEAQVEVARKKLALIQAGVKSTDIEAQKMEIARWQSEYDIANNDYKRYEELRNNQIVTAADLEQKRLLLERNKRTLDAAKERLKSLEEIRKEDVDLQTAELSAALAQVEYARADLERMVVHAPANGRILKIQAHPGEEVTSRGILELGKTDRMYAVAEVYEADIARVRVGKRAVVSSELLPERISGTVTQIASQISKTELLPMETSAFADTRVIKVKIQLDNPDRAAGLIYGKVEVVIEP